jgi:peptidoglycan/LPS O-acetylase OafA/YrhL
VPRPGALVRRLLPRSVPALAASAVFMGNSVLLVAITGKHTISIDGDPTRTEWFVLGLLVLVLPIAALVGWRISRLRSVRSRLIAAPASIALIIACGIVGGPSEQILANLVLEAVVIGGGLLLTACGIGSILGWALRTAVEFLDPLIDDLRLTLVARSRYRAVVSTG